MSASSTDLSDPAAAPAPFVPAAPASAPPRERFEAEVARLLEELAGPRPRALTLKLDLERDLGLGSLERTELILRVERALEVRLPDRTLDEAVTLGKLWEVAERALQAGGDAGAGAAGGRGLPASVAPPSPARLANDPARGLPGWDLPDTVTTLVEVARYRAQNQGDWPHLHLLADDLSTTPITFREFWERSCIVAGGVASLGVGPGDRVALVLPSSVGFFEAFLGVSCAGGVPVPIYPPIRMDELSSYLDRHARILENAGVRAIITDDALRSVGRLLADRMRPAPEVATVPELAARGAATPLAYAGDGEALGLIQYTSGSTGDPKGVALRQRNLLANCRAIGDNLGLTTADSCMIWLPLYHDMGLIGCWMSTLCHAMPIYVMSPLQFLARPERWLQALGRYRVTISPSPNFGYELCSRKIEDRDLEGVDLSSWRSAVNGAEPVRPETLARFYARFSRFGLQREALSPVYGLAESSVAVCFPPPGRGPRLDRVVQATFVEERRADPCGPDEATPALTFVSAGLPLPRHEVRIVRADDARGATLPERTEGRIQFRGPSTMVGYFDRPEATSEVLLPDGWVETGDLGYLAEGELFVTGRVKDLVIKAGRKYHPQDIELAAWEAPGIRKGLVVAFSVPDPKTGEAIVLVCESREPKERHEDIAREVSRRVLEAIGTPCDHVALVPPGTIPKTSSGKLRRRETRERYLQGDLVRPRVHKGWVLAQVAWRAARARGPRALAGIWHAVRGAYAAALAVTLLVAFGLSLRLTGTSGTRAARRIRFGARLTALLSGYPVARTGGALPAGGAVLVSNHASYIDVLAVAAGLEELPTFTPKAPVMGWPIVGDLARRLGAVSIDRSSPERRVQSLEAAVDLLKRGGRLHMFPEATFARARGILPFRLGAFDLAARAGVPVVPVALLGARQVLPDGASLPRPGRIEARVLAPHAPPTAGDFTAISRLRDEVRRALAEAVGEPVLEIQSAEIPWGARDARAAEA